MPAANLEAIADALETEGVELIVRVVPGVSTIARLAELPSGADSESKTLAALSLLAESDLPGTLPSYRRAAGVLPLAAPGRGPAALLAGWAGTPPAPDEVRGPWRCPVVWTPEVVGVAAIAQALGSNQVAAYADALNGGVSVVANGPGKSLARVLRVPSGAGARSAAARVIDESARGAGLEIPAPRIGSDYELVLQPAPSGNARALGRTSDGVKLDEFGVAMGAILAATHPNAAVRSLCELSEAEPRGRASVVERSVRWLGVPTRAAVVIVACVLALLAVPIGVAYARYNVLKQRVAGDATLGERIDKGEKQVALYKLLREKRWPMTKLMADVAGAAPVGVTLEVLELAQGEGVTIRGVAESSDLVTSFRENLGKTKVFTQVTTPTISASTSEPGKNADAGVVQFQLSAKIAPGGATYAAKPIEDFAQRPLVARLYGEGTHTTPRAGQRSRGSAPERGARAERSRGSAPATPPRSGETGGSRSAAPGSTAGAKPAEVPPPISDEQIAKLDGSTAMMEFAKRRRASTQPGVDAATKQRLEQEADKARQRMQAINQSKGGG